MSFINTSLEGNVAILSFNRPEKLNALCTPMLEELRSNLEACETNSSVRTIILTGTGRAFVAGADIEEYVNQEANRFMAYQQYSRKLFSYIHHYPKPVIAAVNGYALGGGFEIVLSCDIVIAAENAKFGLPETRLGLIPGGGGIQKLNRLVGRHVASDVLFSGRRLSADEALQLHVASHVAPAEQLLEFAMAKAKDISKSSPTAIRELKRVLHEGAEANFEAALSYEQEVLFRMFVAGDGPEGIRAFVEKRSPQFEG